MILFFVVLLVLLWLLGMVTSYTLGGSSALEVIDAQRTLLDAQTQYAAALAAANDAIADLERATGAPFSASRGGSNAR